MSIDWNWLRWVPVMWALALGSCGGPDGDGKGPDRLDPVPSGETGDALHSAAPPGGSGATGATGHTAAGGHTGTPATWPQFAHCGPLVVVEQAGSSGGDLATGLAITPDGVVMGGVFSGNATFGGTTQIAGAGIADGFVARYADDGTLRWVRSASTAQTSKTDAIAFDVVRGRTVAAGYFSSDVTIEGGGVQLVLVEEDRDGWVVAWDDAGTAEWATAIGNVGSLEEIEDLAFGPDGEVYVVGTTDDPGLHATGGPSSTRVDAVGLMPGVTNGFLLRIEPDGTPAWFRTFSGALSTRTTEVEVTDVGSVLVGSSMVIETLVDRGGAEERSFTATGGEGALFTTWAGDGRLMGGFVVGPSGGFAPGDLDALSTTSTGVAAAGVFGPVTTWGAGFPGATTVAATETTVALFDLDGALVGPLIQVAGSPDYTAVRPATLDDDGTGTLALAGYQTGLFTWAPGTAREAVIDVGPLDPEGLFPSEPVLVTYAPDGSLDCLWHLDAMASGNRAYQAAFDGRGGVWVVGTFSYTFVVNEGTPSAVTLDTVPEGAGTHHEGDAFLARFLLRPP